MTQQLAMNFDTPSEPASVVETYDLDSEVTNEHNRAELQRLDGGWSGCGCTDCQKFYKTIDLAVYGNRVEYSSDVITIKERPGGGGYFSSSEGEILQYIDGRCYGILLNGKTIRIGSEVAVKAVIVDPELHYDIPIFDQMIELERKLQEGEKDGRKPDLQKPGAFRSRITRMVKRRTANARPTKTRKRLPVYKT